MLRVVNLQDLVLTVANVKLTPIQFHVSQSASFKWVIFVSPDFLWC